MLKIKEFSTHKLCRWVLIHSFLYYQLATSVISDETFDEITKDVNPEY